MRRRLSEGRDIPRWAAELGAETWERINELLYDGWQPAAVRSELGIPDSKKRSLELHARKYRHRRILAPVARLGEMIAGGAVDIGPGFLRLLQIAVDQGLHDEKKALRTAGILSQFMGRVLEVGARAEDTQAKREAGEERQRGTMDAAEAMRRMLRDYGVKFEGDGNSE